MNSAHTKVATENAFTLIELLIVVSLITIITGAILPSFNSYIDTQNVKQAQEQVKDELRTVQNKALNGENASIELINGQVEYWGMEFNQGDTTYETFISTATSVCGGAGTEGTDRMHVRDSVALPGNSEIITPITGCVYFSFSNGDAFFSGGADTIIVGPPGASSSDTTCRRVNIYSNGLIESDSDVSCS